MIFAAGMGALVHSRGVRRGAAATSGRDVPPLSAATCSTPRPGTFVPWILVFAAYVLIHGHTSPGGGFQGGVLFGSGLVAMPPDPRPQSGGIGRLAGPGLRAALVMACAGAARLSRHRGSQRWRSAASSSTSASSRSATIRRASGNSPRSAWRPRSFFAVGGDGLHPVRRHQRRSLRLRPARRGRPGRRS